MKKSITIQIPEPCHEDWQKMTQTEKGKFCGVCTKDVIDFTSKTDEDLVKSLADSKNICGRFKKTQLNREVKMERKSGLNLAPFAASLLLPLSLLNTNPANSSNNNVPEKEYNSLNIGRFSNPNRAIINTIGRITDTSGKALANVIIRANESKNHVKSDNNGYYSITTMDRELLHFERDGFVNQEIELGSYSSEKNVSMIHVMIEEDTDIMGDIVEIILKDISEAVTIHGTVRDEFGLLIPGVNIMIEGTKIETQTDFDGNYSLEVEANQKLEFSYFGFATKTVSVSNISNDINVTLESNEEFTREVIVVGMVAFGNNEPTVAPPNAAEMDAQGKARKLAAKNGKEFRRIQREKEKATRKLKRSRKK